MWVFFFRLNAGFNGKVSLNLKLIKLYYTMKMTKVKNVRKKSDRYCFKYKK